MKFKVISQSFRLPGGRILMYAEYGAPNGKPIFYFHGLADSRLEPAVLDIDVLEEAGIRLIACDRPGMSGSDFQPGRGFSHWPADIVTLADMLGLVSSGSGAFQAVADMYRPVPA